MPNAGDAGYGHPLYSFELIARTTALPAALARYVVAIPQGFLTVRAQLLRRGARVDSDTCHEAVLTALASHKRLPLARYGLGPEWAEALRYWDDRMYSLHEERAGSRYAREVYRRLEIPTLLPAARRLWQQLVLISRLAGVGQTLAVGRAPRAGLLLLERLTQLQREVSAAERAVLLARFGFGPEEQARLVRVIAAMGEAREAENGHQQERRSTSDQLVVMRAALIGDLSRLSQIAPLVDPLHAARLRMGCLLGRKKKRATAEPPEEPRPALPPAGA